MESTSMMDFSLGDFISLWKDVHHVEDPAYLDTPVTPSAAPVAQEEPSCDLRVALDDFLATAELVPNESLFVEEIFVDFLIASDPDESDLRPSPQKKSVSDCRPTNHQDTSAAPPTSATDDAASRKRKLDETEGKPYIKKPPNAFMLFKAEQRHNVVEELKITNSAHITVVLGQRDISPTLHKCGVRVTDSSNTHTAHHQV
ncbi:uncharacterized protein [Eucyclogobius newberryi]|uniref:uncharacterized protein n=1 Tax=Eucyclogobius newberryi TaxID=166745 RepID=UPI003B5B3DF9